MLLSHLNANTSPGLAAKKKPVRIPSSLVSRPYVNKWIPLPMYFIPRKEAVELKANVSSVICVSLGTSRRTSVVVAM